MKHFGGNNFTRLECEMEALFREFFGSRSPLVMLTRSVWQPPTDVYETEQNVVVRMEVPGVRPENLVVMLMGDILEVRGFRSDPAQGQKVRLSQMEIHYGPFQRRIRLHQPIDGKRYQARYRDGFLEVELRKATAPEVLVKEISIRIS